jgi:hypothetical protein
MELRNAKVMTDAWLMSTLRHALRQEDAQIVEVRRYLPGVWPNALTKRVVIC